MREMQTSDDAERHRDAAWRRPVTIRLAGSADDRELARLAGLDSRPLPPGPHLIAERDGRIEAAISVRSGESVANPFERTLELRALLRCHAGPRPGERSRALEGRLRPRPLLAPA
jgi:hypothetical protein